MSDTKRPASPKIVLAGNNQPAIYVLDLLLDRLDPTALLVVAPPGGKGRSWQPSLADAAAERGFRCLTPDDINAPDVVDEVATHGAELLLSVYYTQVFKPPFLKAVPGQKINFHPALLPRHRGTAPLIWAIVEGDRMAGLTVHHIDEGIDTGETILQTAVPIHSDDTGYDLHRKMGLLVRSVAADLLRQYFEDGTLPEATEQVGNPSYHSSKDGKLNHLKWTDDGERIRNVVRALASPMPGAFVETGGERMVLERVRPVAPAPDMASRPPGSVELPVGQAPLVWSSTGPLRIEAWRDGDVVRPGEELSDRLREGMILS